MTFPALLIVGVSLDCVRGEGFFQFAEKKKNANPSQTAQGKRLGQVGVSLPSQESAFFF